CERVACCADEARFRGGSRLPCSHLSGTEEKRSGANGTRTRVKARSELCRGETASAAFAKHETGWGSEVKFGSAQFALYVRRFVSLAAFATAIAICCSLGAARAQEKQNSPLVLGMKIDGEIGPVLATYVEEGLTDAAQRHAALVLISMDTPGGLSDSTQKIVQRILDSPVPVAVYVAPKGAR